MIARRRHREERGWLQADISRSVRAIADIDRQLPELESRLEGICGDRIAVQGWYGRQAEAARLWRELMRRGVRASVAERRPGRRHRRLRATPLLPSSLSAQWAWWSEAIEVERARLWDGAPTPTGERARPRVQRSDPADQPSRAVDRRPDVADILRRVDAAEDAAQRRRELPQRYTRPPSVAQSLNAPALGNDPAQQHRHAQPHNGPTMSP